MSVGGVVIWSCVVLWCGAVPAWWVRCGVGVVPVQPVFSLVCLVTIKVGSCTRVGGLTFFLCLSGENKSR